MKKKTNSELPEPLDPSSLSLVEPIDGKFIKVDNISMPLIALRGISLFPRMVQHFDVGRPMSIKALEAAMADDQRIFLVTQKNIAIETPNENDFYHIGNIAKINQMLRLPDNSIRVLVEVIERASIFKFVLKKPYFKVELSLYREERVKLDSEMMALIRGCIGAFEKYLKISAGPHNQGDLLMAIHSLEEQPEDLSDLIASHIMVKQSEKQILLESIFVKNRLETLLGYLLREIEVLELEKDITDKVRGKISKSQRQYFLREQIKVIKDELGEEDVLESEVEEMRTRLKKLKLPKAINKKISNEIERYVRIPPNSSESGVIRSYVMTILSLPWKKQTVDDLDIKKAEKILDEDHYGLEKVKERVLEHLAVKTLTSNMKGQIICLVGPPGVGKTSVAKSIARSLNKKFTRMSLGGVRDEAEIRGHRRTYVGAIPGRIINGIKEAGTKNPLFLFDEIDKLSNDFRGDPSSALLEVLDPEQNKEFTDHYLEVPFDLSDVMFIATANTLSTIPRALLDRMEVIRISGYTEIEKLNIAKKYLVSKKMKEHGLQGRQISISEDSILEIIRSYTRESGVRELERQIAVLCRKAAVRIVKEKIVGVRVTTKNIVKYLGNKKFRFDLVSKSNQIGIATGLAWTSVGGETLSIEVNIMSGSGKLKLTGQLGDIMKESAQAAFTFVRSISDKYGIDEEFHKNQDIHIHIPEGAIPKDGPSAGITIATALVSALSGASVNRFVAMTGEITLRGRVLAIGGLKEKSLAALRAGIKTVLYPAENATDYDELPELVRKSIDFIPVTNMEKVLEYALKKDTKDTDED